MATLSVGGQAINYRCSDPGNLPAQDPDALEKELSYTAPPIVALHCSSSHSGQWKALMKLMGDEHLVIAPDFHGYGSSAPLPQDNRPYFIHDVAIVKAIVGLLGEPVHLVGHSLGGAVAVRAALDFPEQIQSLTLIEPVLFNLLEETGVSEGHEYREIAHDMLIMNQYGTPEMSARRFMDFWIGEGKFDAIDDDTREYIIRTIDRVADDWRGISIHAPGQCNLKDLEKLKMPVLIISADQTRSSTRAIVELITDTIVHAEHKIIVGAGHLSPITDPDKVNPLIRSFLSDQKI